MDRLTISGVESLRASCEPLSTAVSPYTSSDSFKSPHSRRRPRAKSLSHHFSIESRDFVGSALKKSANHAFKHRVIPLGTGRPTAQFYPWNSATCEGGLTHPLPKTSNSTVKCGASRVVDQREGVNFLARSLNYGHAAGSPALVRFMTEHVEIVHNPPYQNWGTCLSCGSSSALEVALRVFCNRGDTILTERYTYPGLIGVAPLVGAHTLGVEMDAEGLIPDLLNLVLCTWDASRGPKPRVLYTIPSGQNPTGITLSLARKKAIYQVAEEHDLVIIEDDPYYFLQIEPHPAGQNNTNGAEAERLTEATGFLARVPPSFLSLDKSGRVVRLDSASKILAPGLRAGWVTASDQVIDKFLAYFEVSTGAVSGPTQMMLGHLFDTWGHVGFFSWLEHLSLLYRSRLEILLAACDKYLPRKVCGWEPPQNGMFLWISIEVLKHPSFRCGKSKCTDVVEQRAHILDIEGKIVSRALENGVQVTKGSLFDADGTPDYIIHIRLTDAAVEEELDLEDGVLKFANAVREEFDLDKIC